MSSYNNTTAILAVNSLDRYVTNLPVGRRLNPNYNPAIPVSPNNPRYIQGTAPQDGSLDLLYTNQNPFGNSFIIQAQNALIYGYIKSIAVSQVQIQYRIPTVVPTNFNSSFIRSGNDTFYIVNQTNNLMQPITIPYGFYTPVELAAMLTTIIRNTAVGNPLFTVQYFNTDGNSFIFSSNNGDNFYFPTRAEINIQLPSPVVISDAQWNNVLRAYRLLGITIGNSDPSPLAFSVQITRSPNFLYTSFIDICSKALTKYQKIADTDTSVNKRNAIVSRIYVSGVGISDPTSADYSLGCQPFIMTADLNTPKTIRWNREEAVYELDFQLYDEYGFLIYWDNIFPTEFQMTLLATEGEE